MFVCLFVCLLRCFHTLFVAIFNRFQCFTVLFCFPFYSISGSDTNAHTHRETEKHTRHTTTFFKRKVYMEFRMNFYSLSLPFFLFIMHSDGISQIPTNLQCIMNSCSFFYFFILCSFICSFARLLGIKYLFTCFFLALFELWYICGIF